jgi:NO-binding membrane sensor protein with MHYT domain
MLAFSPGMPSGYNVALTSLSLVAAIVLTGVGFAVAVAPNLPASASIGGAIVGGGIAAMHYTGMAAFEVQGHILWDPVLVSASITLGALFGAIALPVGLHRGGIQWKIFGALLLTLAICSHHSTAMGATLLRIRRFNCRQRRCASGLLAIAVALRPIIVVKLAGAAIKCASPAQQRPNGCRAVMRQSRGLVVATARSSQRSTTASRFSSDRRPDDMVGTTLGNGSRQRTRLQLLERPDQPVRVSCSTDGSRMPVGHPAFHRLRRETAPCPRGAICARNRQNSISAFCLSRCAHRAAQS